MNQAKEESGKKLDSLLLTLGRKAGAGMHFTSLPGPHGTGDIADSAFAFIDMLVEMGIGVWQFLPTGPTAYGDSPYQPLSVFAGNAMLVGLDALVREGLLGPSSLAELAGLPTAYVDYQKVIPARQAALSSACRRFNARRFAGLRTAYEEFLHAHDRNWLHDYAMFRMLKTRHGEQAWPNWEASYLRREPAALRAAEAKSHQTIDCIKFIQFLFDRQWHDLKQYAGEHGIVLFGDMPIYIALDSADAWTQPALLQIDAAGRPIRVAGVPPDYFSSEGQLWGNPVYDWQHHRSTGFRWWTERLRHATRQAQLIRIDHFRGFESFWSVAAGEDTARSGTWEPGPGDALFDALSQSLGRLPIVAEDLGVITPEVTALRLRHGLPGMRVLQFEVGNPAFDVDGIEENCVCYTGTHDNDTTAGWFHGGHEDTRTTAEVAQTRKNVLRLTGGSAQTIHWDMIKLAYSSPAALAIAPMQDYLGLGSEARLNTPGSTGNNWRWRFRPECMQPGLADRVAELAASTGRGRT